MNDALARVKIKELIRKYDAVKSSGKINSYTEQETKNAFIQPLFEALGWDFSEKEEVSAEEHIISSGRVDYGFYINSRIKFYLEAKPLKADLNNEEYARQAIRYSFNKGVTWAVLTDFEGLKVFNAQSPSKYLGDKKYFELKYQDYLQHFDKLWELSKEAFTQDLIDKKAEEAGKKLQRVPITELLSKDLNECRKILTDHLSTWNRQVLKDDLDEGVQKLLDRLIFIRVAEDRKIEENILQPLINQWRSTTGANRPELYESMVHKFRELDNTYNSNLFSEHPFEKWEDDGVALEKVIKILYGKHGYYEYDFSIMSADILGSVYENYLGYKLSQSRKGLTLDKAAGKRKEQGIYYTPDFIVDYIVRNALKPVLDKCASINDLKKIKVLDPACGSGSFLIKALEVITEKYQEFKRPIDEFTKIQIILENLYGVDLDEQAVEIARLNLLINALQDKGKLPKLDKNIKNGNSLISGTDEELKKYFGKNFRDKKPFNWTEEFPEVFKQGGFNVIIGNPPYIRVHKLSNEDKKYLWANYEVFKAKSDLYACFIQKSIDLLKNNGRVSFIVSNTWLSLESFTTLRRYILDNCEVVKLTTPQGKVFQDATVETIIFLFAKNQSRSSREENKIEILDIADFRPVPRLLISQKEYGSNRNFSFNVEDKLMNSIDTVPLKEYVNFSYGFKTGDDEKFITRNGTEKFAKKILRRSDFGRYFTNFGGEYVIYDPLEMVKHRRTARPGNKERFEQEKITVQDIGRKIVATLDKENFYIKDALILVGKKETDISLYFILAILNSSYISLFYKNLFKVLSVAKNAILDLPFPKSALVLRSKREQYNKLVEFAKNMLFFNEKLRKVPTNSNKWNSLKSEIEKTDKKIDEEVYKLYGLTKEEIEIIEKS